jgi:transportin-1
MPQEDAYTRTLAGLNLKNNIRTYFNTIPPPVMAYVKECCVQHIGEPDASVRKAVGLVITAIVTRGQVHNWPQILQILMEKLDSSDADLVEVGIFLDVTPHNIRSTHADRPKYNRARLIL